MKDFTKGGLVTGTSYKPERIIPMNNKQRKLLMEMLQEINQGVDMNKDVYVIPLKNLNK